MPSELDFQTITSIALNLPETPLGWLFIGIWLLVLGSVMWVGGSIFRTVTARQWGYTAALSLLAFAFAIPRFELVGGSFLPVLGQLTNGITYRPLGFVAVALAAWYLNPMLALLVGASEGLSRALFDSHQLADIFHYALVGMSVSLLIQQKIRRLDWDFWRVPPIATTLGQLFIGWPLVFLATFFLVQRGTPFLAGLDLALATARPQWMIALLEGVISGGVVWAVKAIWPYRPEFGMTSPPFEQDIRYRQTLQFLFYTIVSLILLGSVVSLVGYRSARALIQTQMAHEADQVSQEIPNFIGRRQSALLEWGDDPRLHSGDFGSQQESLEELFRSGTLYRRVLLADADGRVLANYPADGEPELSNTEAVALADAVLLNGPGQTFSIDLDGHAVMLSLVAEATLNDGEPLYLIGRIPDQILHDLVDGLAAGYAGGRGYLIDENRLVVADTAGIEQAFFETESRDNVVVLTSPDGIDGSFSIEPDSASRAREIRYITRPDDGHPWNVVSEVPMGVVLQQAFRLVAGVLLITILSSMVFGLILARQGDVLGTRLHNLLASVEKIPDLEPGHVVIPAGITSQDDEISQLGIAFEQMQRQLDENMRELNLLLNISTLVAETKQNIQPGMQSLLEKLVSDTKAISGRVVLTVLGSKEIEIGAGPIQKDMRSLDKLVLEQVRGNQDLILSGPDAVRRLAPHLSGTILPFQSAIAYPLQGAKHNYGVLWLAYPEPQAFRQSERDLIRSVSEQASVMVANWFYLINLDKRWRELSAVLNATDDPMVVIDATNRISMMNAAARGEFSVETDSDILNQPVTEIIDQPELTDLFIGKSTLNGTEGITLENGKTFDVNVSLIKDRNGRDVGRVAALRDISKMAEINELKSEFVRLASHDLKDPITIVNGFIQILQMDPQLSESQAGHVSRMQAAMDQMQKLVEDLLNITRLEAGLELEMVPVSIKEIFSSVAYTFESLAANAGNTLVTDVPADLPKIDLNHTFVQQAVANLVSNAIKYAPDCGEVLMRAEETADDLIISVTDKGEGIPAEVQPRIFEKFYRFSKPGYQRGKSHGLGLSFVQLVAERHQGKIWFESEEGKGTTFFLSFPKNKQSAPPVLEK